MDTDLQPFKDQWMYLAGLPRLSHDTVKRTLARIARIAPLPPSFPAESEQQSGEDLVLQNDNTILDLSQPRIRPGMVSGAVTVRLDAQVHVLRSLPAPILAALRREAQTSAYH